MNTFSEQTFAFLMENRFRDSKEWYQEHKPDYEAYVLQPFRALVEALVPTMLAIDPQIITGPKPDRLVSRVWRDTRFSKDKTLFRDHMWCTFNRDKKLYHGSPAFFFEISPDWFQYGCGYYQASPAEMDACRQLILERTPAFQKAQDAYRTQDRFVMEGDRYKRSRFPDQPEDLRNWLDRKNLFFTCRSTDFPVLFSPQLPDVLAEGFQILQPVYRFLLDAHHR